ncbi:MAG TPA: DUF5320 family protein [Bacillota bacterium]|nr:DUF5320 family protein [Bacillota bacterium]
MGRYQHESRFWRRRWGRFPGGRAFWLCRPLWGWCWAPWLEAPYYGAPPWAGPYELEKSGADMDEAEWLKAEAAALRAEAEAIKKELEEIERRLAEIEEQEEE